MKRIGRVWMVVAVCFAVWTAPAFGEDEEDTGWKDTAELNFVMTTGNSESSTFGFKNTLSREWDSSAVKVTAGGLRVETTTKTVTATAGPPIVITETETTETTAENYFLNGRYDRKITEEFFWYAGTGWDRNRFAGIANRYVVLGGVGNIWIDNDDVKFSTDYALTYTDQEDVVMAPGTSDTFAGARFSWDYANKFGKSAEYGNVLVLDGNLDETSDYRADMTNSLSVSMTEQLALKVSLRLLYDNKPAFQAVDVVGAVPPQTVFVELDDLDTILTVALVVNFP